jgi:hypothetical protein
MEFLWLFLIALAALAVWRSLVSKVPESDARRPSSSSHDDSTKPGPPPSMRHN